MTDPRKQRAYREARQKFLATHDPVCHWCGVQVFDTVPASHPRKATVDHLVEVDRAASWALDVTLWVVACRRCNDSRGAQYGHAKRKRQRTSNASRQW